MRIMHRLENKCREGSEWNKMKRYERLTSKNKGKLGEI